MGLRELDLQSEYHSLEEDIVKEFLIPALSEAVRYDRAAGYFSSSGLAKQTVGISRLAERGGNIRIITSPCLSEADAAAIAEGYQKREIVRKCLLSSLEEPKDDFEAERLNLLANLIAHDVLDIKVALLRHESGIFHDKFGIIYDEVGDAIAYRGSMNESENAFYHNYDSIDVYGSWNEEQRVVLKEETFDSLWDGNSDPNIETVEFPEINEAIIKKYRTSDSMDGTIDLRQFGLDRKNKNEKKLIHKPDGITLHPYQIGAIDEWERNGYTGIFDMATGSGKTYTALGAIERFEEKHDKVGVVICCPYTHLVDQWREDVEAWGADPIIAYSKEANWRKKLIRAYKRFRDFGRSFVCLTTNDSFRDKIFQEVIGNITSGANFIFIVDEAHNFGAKYLSGLLPYNISYRLGLSATVERYMDKEGTKKLFDYFGKKCIEYTLERAIKEGALVQYEYYPVIVTLSPDELDEYNKLTRSIVKCITKEGNKLKISKAGEQLVFKRSRLVAGAESKIGALKEKLEPYRNERHILVYCGASRGLQGMQEDSDSDDSDDDRGERQIKRVTRMIGIDLGMTVHQFTSEEDEKTRALLKSDFADGNYQVLTAIKCLDEGVNIPNIHYAFILASSRNPKEFIQRRGRVLRKAKGKDRAVIYDFVTLPRPLSEVGMEDFDRDRALVIGEMARVYEFGRYAINSRIADKVLDDISEAYGLEMDYEDLGYMMEEENGSED